MKTNPIRRKSVVIPAALACAGVLLISSPAFAQVDKTWIGGNSSWSTAGNWTPSGAPTPSGSSGDNVFITTSGDIVNLSVPVGNATTNLGNFTIGTGATLQGTSGGFPDVNIGGVLSNAGTIQATTGPLSFRLNGADKTHSNSGLIQAATNNFGFVSTASNTTFGNSGTLRAASGRSFSFTFFGSGGVLTNTGLIEATGANSTMTIVGGGGTLSNAGGTLQAVSGGTIDTGNTSALTVSGGNLTIGTGSLMRGNRAVTFNNVTTDSSGSVLVSMNQSGGFPDTASNTFNGGSFANSGTISIENTSNSAGLTFEHAATFTSNTTFTNNGTVNVSNSATGSTSGSGSKTSTFQVASGSSFTNAGSILVSHTSAVVNSSARFLVNNGASGANDFTNGGNVTVTGTAASFNVQNGRDYLQSAASATTLLQNSGTLQATNVNITGGSLGGIGTVTGAISIGANGTLFAGSGSTNGNLAVGAVNLASGADLAFNLTSEASYSQIVGTSLTLANGAYTITLSGVGSQSISEGDSFTLFTGSVTNFAGATFNIVNNTDWTGGWQVSEGSLIVTAVPEPSTWVLMAIGLTSLVVFRRRRAA